MILKNFLLLAIFGFVGAQVPTIDEKVQNLYDLTNRNPIIKLNMDKWKLYVRQQPRNYSMMVMFTALSPNVNCPICKPAFQEFQIVANSQRYMMSAKDRASVFFAIVDYEDAPQIFQQMNLNTAPMLYHFGPKQGAKKKPDQMDFQRHGFDADAIAKFIAEQTDLHIRVFRPPNYTATITILLLALLVGSLLYLKRNSLEFIRNRSSWGIICLVITFVFLSGQMWNHIRGPPFVITNPQTRETNFVHSSTQFQLVSETYIVGALYALVTVGFILLNEAADGQLLDKKNQGKKNSILQLPSNALAIAGAAFVCIFFSLLLSVFRSKYRGYPYSFLFS